jgi:hypothetical protein
MIETLNSVESLETLLKELEPELPFCVYFLGPLLGSESRCSQDVCNPKTPPPNPIRNHPYSGLVGFSPLLVMVELFDRFKDALAVGSIPSILFWTSC